MNLAPNFSLDEFCFSETALRAGIDNRLPSELIPAARALAGRVLQPLRDALGAAVLVLSGYRSQAVERVLKRRPASWVSQSQHTRGEAADIRVDGMSNVELLDAIVELGLPVDQLILEFPYSGWVHVSHRLHGPQRGEVLTTLDGRSYLRGVVLP